MSVMTTAHLVWLAGRVLLAVVTALLLASMGGAFIASPALVPLHILAARSSGRIGRACWSWASGAGVGMAAWAATYTLVGEQKPAIWLVPLMVLVVGGALVFRWSTPRPEPPT